MVGGRFSEDRGGRAKRRSCTYDASNLCSPLMMILTSSSVRPSWMYSRTISSLKSFHGLVMAGNDGFGLGMCGLAVFFLLFSFFFFSSPFVTLPFCLSSFLFLFLYYLPVRTLIHCGWGTELCR